MTNRGFDLDQEMPDADGATRVRWLFESAFGRLPTQRESGACLESLGELGRLQNTTDARSIEAWTELCHALLNANDFIYVK